MPKLKALCMKYPKVNYSIFKLWNITIISKSLFWLNCHISLNIDTTDTYYKPKEWKLSQDHAELYRIKLPWPEAEIS